MSTATPTLTVFGAGVAGARAVKELSSLYDIKYFADNDQSKWGSHYLDIPVISPGDIAEKNSDFVLIASMYYEDILPQLIGLGVPRDRILSLDEDIVLNWAQRKVDKDPYLKNIADRVSDETIIHIKGEQPELLYTNPISQQQEPRTGRILTKKIMYAEFVRFVEFMAKEEGLKRLSVLDVGATHSLLFELMGKTGTAVNVAEKSVAQMNAQGIDSHLVSGDRMPFEDDSFDLVLCFNTLSHMDNPIGAMREMRRVGRKALIVTDGDVDDFGFLDYISPVGDHRTGKFRWPSPEFHRLAEYTGMKVVEEKVFNCLDEDQNPLERVYQSVLGNRSIYRMFGVDLQK